MLESRNPRESGKSIFEGKKLSGEDSGNKVTQHMANERTYLAWVRTGISIIALGFVVSKFGIIIRDLVPNSPQTSSHLSTIVGVFLVVAGGFMQLLALRSFVRNRKSIEKGDFSAPRWLEISAGAVTFAVAIVLVAYLLISV